MSDTMGRREFLKLAGMSAAALSVPLNAGAGAAAAQGGGARPNILFVHADDYRADCIGALGHPVVKTPNLDVLVRRGFSFSRVYTMGSMIGAVCLPSRTMMQTGRSLFHIPGGGGRGAAGEKVQAPILAAALRAAGYETFHAGKSGNEFKAGIEAFEHNIVKDDRIPAERSLSSQGHADVVIDFLKSRKGDRPFFVYMAPPVPHDPRVAPEEFMKLYDPEKIPLPAAYLPVHPFDNGEMTVRDEALATWPRTPEIVRRHLADYFACVSCLDHHIGRIIECLKERGGLDNTIVVFSGDNGLSLGEHGLFGKQNLYEFGGMHVPLVFAGPGIPQGRSEAFAYLMDLFPTFCELTGTPIPEGVEARSLAPVIRGQARGVREAMFTLYRDCQRAVRDECWKLIRYPLVDRTQLFDLETDPHELSNLAENPEQAEKVAEMMGILKQLQREFDDKYPLKVGNPQPAQWTPPAGGQLPAAMEKNKENKKRNKKKKEKKKK